MAADVAAMLAVALTTLSTYFVRVLPRSLPIRDGAGLPVPPERDERLAGLATDLERQGFVRYGTFAPIEGAAPPTMFGRLLIHPSDFICASAIDMQSGDMVSTYVELTTEWPDGTAVSTVTSTLTPIFETLPRVSDNRLPGADVLAAVASHRELCRSIPGRPLDPPRGDPIEVAQERNVEVLEHQVKCGVLKPKGEDYRFTFRGARRSVWRVSRAMNTAG